MKLTGYTRFRNNVDKFRNNVDKFWNKFQTVAPALLILFSSLQFPSCGSNEDWTTDRIEVVDRTPPEFTVFKNSNIDVTWWKTLEIKWNVLYIWGEPIVSRWDKESQIKSVKIYFNWNEVGNWDNLNVDGEVKVVTRNEGNLSSNTTFNVTTNAPELMHKDTLNVFFWWNVETGSNFVKVWWDTVFFWNRWKLISLTFNKEAVSAGGKISWEWKLVAIVIDWKESSAEVTVINSWIEWLNVLENLDIKAGQTINLRDYIKPVEWCEISDDAVLVPENWEKQAVKLSAFSVDKPWNYTLIIKVFDKSNNTKSKTVEIKISISDVPIRDFPNPNRNIYFPWINNLPESTRKVLNNYLVINQLAKWINDKEMIVVTGWENSWLQHGKLMRDIMEMFAQWKVVWNEELNWKTGNLTFMNWPADITKLAKENPDAIIVASFSVPWVDDDKLKELSNCKNFLITQTSQNPDATELFSIYNSSSVEKSWKWSTIDPADYSKAHVVKTYIDNLYIAVPHNSEFWYGLRPTPNWFSSTNWSIPSTNWSIPFSAPSLTVNSGRIGPDRSASTTTALLASNMWNLLKILSKKFSGKNVSELKEIIKKYFVAKDITYINQNWEKKSWGKIYELDTQSLIEKEFLPIDEIKNLCNNGQDFVELPAKTEFCNLCYTWKWVGFWIGNTYYRGLTDDNMKRLSEALKKKEDVKWFYSNSRWNGEIGIWILNVEEFVELFGISVNFNNNNKVGKRKVPGNKYNMWGNNNDKALKKQQKYIIERHGKLANQEFKNSRNGK